MLSKTAERNPRPSVDGHEAGGNFSTGISDADKTSARRKIEPLNVSGSNSQSGRRSPAESRRAIQTAAPMKGKLSAKCGNFKFNVAVLATARTRINATI